MRAFILGKIQDANLALLGAVETFFQVEKSLTLRVLATLFFAFLGLCTIFVVHDLTGHYFPTIAVVTAILVSLFSGLLSGIVIAIGVALIADYLFIPPNRE